jgi:Mor family transcriptional regulator
MNRSGKLLAKNDAIIREILSDPLFEIKLDGSVWTQITETGKVSVNGLWREAGALAPDGYREIKYKYKKVAAHRLVYAKFNGELAEDLMVNHKNGIRSDNRPENLELIPQSENNLHRFRVLGRAPVIGNKKISDATADLIRNDHASGLSYRALMAKYRLAKSSISYIINKKTWNRNVSSSHDFEYKTKASLEVARSIRQEYVAGAKQKDLAAKYSLSLTTIKDICTNRIWKEAA